MTRMNRPTFVALVVTLLAVGAVRLEAAGEPEPKPKKTFSRSKPVMHVDFPDERPENRKVLDVLDKKMVSVNFNDQPVKDALAFLQMQGGINIVLDRAKLEDPDQTVTLKVQNVPLGRVIKLFTEQISLKYIVRDGIVFISDEEGVRQYPLTAVYDVRDLLKPRKGLVVKDKGNPTRAALDDLIKIIQQMVEPGTWDAGSGNAIGERTIGGHLVITHTPDTHKKAMGLLDSLRRARVLESAETATYAVGDLVALPGKASTTDFARDPEVARKMTDLVKLIEEVIEPGPWNAEDGAPPRIRSKSDVLVVTHTLEVQAKVIKLLEDLRKTRTARPSAGALAPIPGTAVHDVKDLLMRPGESEAIKDAALERQLYDVRLKQLVDMVKQVIEPGTWSADSGNAIRSRSGTIVVTHRADVQARVRKLLKQLRRTRSAFVDKGQVIIQEEQEDVKAPAKTDK